MSKDNTNPTPEVPQDDPKKGEGKEEPQNTFTQEELEKKISERLKRDREKSEKELADRLKKEREDWERQAQLSAEEKEAEERKKREAETADREKEITLRENRAEARELLQEKKIPANLVDFVVDVDKDKTQENISNLEKAFSEAVQTGIDDKLKGQTPKDKTNGTPTPVETGTRIL